MRDVLTAIALRGDLPEVFVNDVDLGIRLSEICGKPGSSIVLLDPNTGATSHEMGSEQQDARPASGIEDDRLRGQIATQRLSVVPSMSMRRKIERGDKFVVEPSLILRYLRLACMSS